MKVPSIVVRIVARERRFATTCSRYPLKLVGGQWTRVSWDQAIDGFADQMFKNIKVENGDVSAEDILREINRGGWSCTGRIARTRLRQSAASAARGSLKPQLDFAASGAPARVLKEEEPFCCIRCGKTFGVKSTIERLTAKLQEQSWVYKSSPQRLDLIKMCGDCRVAFVWQEKFDPHSTPTSLTAEETEAPADKIDLVALVKGARS
jgi:hypothetical protein